MEYRVYVITDEKRRITQVNSEIFLASTDGWTLIDQGAGRRYAHAQNNYFPKSLMDERGVYRYALDTDDKPYELTQEEMDADYDAPTAQPTDAERISALEAALTAIEEGIASV